MAVMAHDLPMVGSEKNRILDRGLGVIGAQPCRVAPAPDLPSNRYSQRAWTAWRDCGRDVEEFTEDDNDYESTDWSHQMWHESKTKKVLSPGGIRHMDVYEGKLGLVYSWHIVDASEGHVLRGTCRGGGGGIRKASQHQVRPEGFLPGGDGSPTKDQGVARRGIKQAHSQLARNGGEV